MASSERRGSLAGPIFVAALISLGVTLLRLYGELQHWSPKFFSREPGGPFSIVGIVWLVPICGIWFARRLGDAGRGPASRSKALLFPIVGFLLIAAATVVVGNPKSTVPAFGKLALVNTASLIGGILAFAGWKDLGRTLLVYGYLARIPVVVVMYVALQANWGTHFEKGMPGLPVMPFLQNWLVIGVLPQCVSWIGFTLVVGGLCGGLVAMFRRAGATAPSAATAS